VSRSTEGGAPAEPGEATKRRRGRPSTPPDELRGRLLDAAERCFEATPFEQVGIMDIVHEAHMSSRSFYRFFDGKAEIAAELAADRAEIFLANMEKIVGDAQNSLEVLDRILFTFLNDLPMIVADLHRLPSSASARIREVLDVYRQKIADVILREITRGLREGLVDSIPDPMSVLLVISGVEGMTIRYTSERRREELVALHPQILEAIQKLFPSWISEDQKIR
jgi:AcrR family transcriptional regulator